MFKKILAYALTVCLLLSLTVPAYAVDDVYSVSDDTAALTAPIFYTPDYYPGAVAEMRSSGLFANSIAHGSYSELNYNPSWFCRLGSVHASLTNTSGDFNALTPSVTADQTDVSGVYFIPRTTFLQGRLLTFDLPSTDDCYFDFQSSNFLFDQQSPQANTFYINGDLTFSLRNLWSFNGSDGDGVALTDSWYLASDPLAVQLVIDGKSYGDIIDVTSYTSPFTALYNGGVPSNATVTFDNLKVYYQGDTPDMIGFRVYTGSAFTDGQYNYNSGGDFIAVEVTNTVTFRCSEIPDITFVQEGGDGYAGDLSGISSLLSQILSSFSDLHSLMSDSTGTSYLYKIFDMVNEFSSVPFSYLSSSGSLGTSSEMSLVALVRSGFVGLRSLLISQSNSGMAFLNLNGSSVSTTNVLKITELLRHGFLGLRSLMVDGNGNPWAFRILDSTLIQPGWGYLNDSGNVVAASGSMPLGLVLSQAFSGLRTLLYNAQSYEANTVFPWQSYNMETHQLNAATNITGQNNLFFTAFQSMEDKLGRLAYVFGSDEDLALKDEADPGTDAFRENFGGGLSLGQISDGADVVDGVNGLFDSGYSFGDAFTEISGESMFTMWFSAENAAAIDSTGSVMALDDGDPYNMQAYFDNVQAVTERREKGEDD